MSGDVLIVGADYDVKHEEKGRFHFHVARIDGPWVHGWVILGVVRSDTGPAYMPGDPLLLLRAECRFALLAGTAPTSAQGDEPCLTL